MTFMCYLIEKTVLLSESLNMHKVMQLFKNGPLSAVKVLSSVQVSLLKDLSPEYQLDNP